MNYVMVPVPEELVGDVKIFLEWGLTQKNLPLEDPAPLLRVLAESDEPARRLLHLLADDTLDDRQTTLREAAAALDTTTREIVGLAGELNFDVAQAGGSTFTIVGKVDPRPIDDGVKENDHRLLMMTAAVAAAIQGTS